MSFVIDGHNLIGALPDADLADPDDEVLLLARLRSYRARTGDSLIVFFDSGDLPAQFPDLSSPGLLVRFSAPGQTADDAIVAFLRSRREPGQYAVVTNDHELSYRVRSAGASVISASDFGQRLARPRRRPPQAPEPGPNPHDPAFADLYAQFLQAEEKHARFGDNPPALPEPWIERLYGNDVVEAQRAARWLGHYGGAQALEPLRDALTHGDARVRAAAVLALGDLRDRAALPDLEHRLAEDAASLVREAAAQSLGLIGNRSVIVALEAAAGSDAKSKVRKAAREALARVRARRS